LSNPANGLANRRRAVANRSGGLSQTPLRFARDFLSNRRLWNAPVSLRRAAPSRRGDAAGG
jgi:hypothetical protein